MSKLPTLNIKSSSLYSGMRNDKGQLCNIYTPLQNLADETTKKLGDFTTEDLNFDMEHPVDIILQDSYDGAVNMIINDGKNRPRLINSRFSVQDENTFKIPDHSGFKDTNIYDEETFDVDTQLKAIPIKIPTVRYDGLIDNGGQLACGTYTFYFKLADADGNETEVVAESGIVQCHIGNTNTPSAIRMGLQNENSAKAIKFTISNIDAGFNYIHILFARSSSGDDQAAATTYNKIVFDFPVDKNGVCDITITGAETIIGISKEECNVDYADINAVKTQAINNNVLLFGNIETPEHDWDAIKRFTWKIIPRYVLAEDGTIGSLSSEYEELSITKDQIEDHGFCYYNTKNVYYRLGYWPDEIYRFGIVYIFNDNSLSPVINLQGIDFSIPEVKQDISIHQEWTNYLEARPASNYELIFFTEDLLNKTRKPEYLYESEDMYFNKKYRTNSRGVIKFPDNVDVKNVSGGVLSPKPLYINFDLSLIGYKYALTASSSPKWNSGDVTNWKDVLKKHNIKGFFFVRQKRIPTILGQGMVIGLSNELCGSLPVIKNDDGKYVVQPFIGQDRLLHEKAQELAIPAGYRFTGENFKKVALFKNQAMLCPDAEIDEATFNQLFVSNDFQLYKEGSYKFLYDTPTKSANISDFIKNNAATKSYKTKLTNVPEDTKTLTNGVDYFSTLAGNPDEPYKTSDILNAWRWSLPQDLSVSTSLLRGKWGPFVGLSNPNEKNPINKNCPFKYGDVFNIKNSKYDNKDVAVDLDFLRVMNSTANFFAISPRMEMIKSVDCFRGDCYISMFTHRMFRNFIDPELPTNNLIVDPSCWAKNYSVRCTALILTAAHSNLTSDSLGFFIYSNPYTGAAKNMDILSLVYFLTGNIIGGIIAAVKAGRYRRKADEWERQKRSILEQYPFGLANEIVQAFEIYTGGAGSSTSSGNWEKDLWGITAAYGGPSSEEDATAEVDDMEKVSSHLELYEKTTRKKVNPKELELQGGLNIKAIFKSDDNWELRGMSGINRADVNAVAMGQWITFPVCSNHNLAMRDTDFSNATEEASFNRKRSFYPLAPKDVRNKLRDSNVINAASKISLPDKSYIQLPKVPYFKLEYFTRIQNSLRSSSNSISNEFKVMLESAYHDYTKVYGSITKLESKGNYVFIIFKHGIGILDMASSIAQAQDATLFLPEVLIISDMYGSIWKDSIIQTPYGIYGVDSVAKVIWRIQGTEVKVISDMKVEKFLIDNLDMSEFNFRPYIGHINIKSHYNAFKHDVMFTYYNDLLYLLIPGYTVSAGYSVDEEGFIIDSNLSRYYKNDNDIEVLYGKATRLLPYYKTTDEDNDGTADLEWKSYSEIIEDVGIDNCVWVKGTNWSLCWNEDLQEFQTFFDWIPVESENIDNIYFSFDRDNIDNVNENLEDAVLIPKFYQQRTKKKITLGNQETLIEYKEFVDSNGSLKLGVSLKKNLIDSAFTNETKIYYIKQAYKNIVLFNGNLNNITKPFITRFNVPDKYLEIKPDEYSVFSLYLRFPDYSETNTNLKITISFFNSYIKDDSAVFSSDNPDFSVPIIASDVKISTNDWIFVPIFIKNNVVDDTKLGSVMILRIEITSNCTYHMCEPKLVSYKDGDVELTGSLGKIWKAYPIKQANNSLFKEYYNVRSTDNSMKLWKHGLAGVYDNQGKIKPTHWYGKQHEFNFEFVVNENSSILKIFNNLKIISNKAEPYKFEYEVVGEAYEWYKYKEIVHWINQKVKDGEFVSLAKAYKFVLKNTISKIREQYLDFPHLFNVNEATYIIPKLPYLEIKLSDKKGLPDKDKSYTKNDNWSSVNKQIGNNDYKLNTVETIIVEDEQLNEYRIHTELYGNDMKKFGRVRGNMEYLEDLWDIEIRPISFRWVYLTDKLDLVDSEIFTDFSGMPAMFSLDTSDSLPTSGNYIVVLENTSGNVAYAGNVLTCVTTGQELVISEDTNRIEFPITLQESNVLEINFKLSGESLPFDILNVYLYEKQFDKSNLVEARLRDKYIKVKVRYTGEDLVIIQAIQTMFDYSFA